MKTHGAESAAPTLSKLTEFVAERTQAHAVEATVSPEPEAAFVPAALPTPWHPAVPPVSETEAAPVDDQPLSIPTRAPVAAASSNSPSSAQRPVDLGQLWDEPAPNRRRRLPRKALWIAGLLAALFLLPVVFGGSTSKHGSESSTPQVPDDLIIHESDLKNRVEVSAADFRPRRRVVLGTAANPTGTAGGPPPLTLGPTDAGAPDLDERRRRRSSDPEDLVAHRERNSSSTGDNATVRGDGFRRAFVYLNAPSPAVKPTVAGHGDNELAPAGALVSASLTTPTDLHGGGGAVTCLAQSETDTPLPKGTQWVGRATVLDESGRLSLRFERVLLPGGREAKTEGEAQDPSGAFGLDAEVSGGTADRAVAQEVAADTASDVVRDTLSTFTGGLLGRVADDAFRRASSHRGSTPGDHRRLSLAAGTKLQIFLHQPVVSR